MWKFLQRPISDNSRNKDDSYNVSKKIPAEQCRWFRRNKLVLSSYTSLFRFVRKAEQHKSIACIVNYLLVKRLLISTSHFLFQSISSSRSRSSSLLPPGTVNSASPSGQKHMNQSGPTVVTITHHKSPAAARRAKSQHSGRLHEVREVRDKNLLFCCQCFFCFRINNQAWQVNSSLCFPLYVWLLCFDPLTEQKVVFSSGSA